MKFYSTQNRQHAVRLEDAVIKGLAPDQGLYMPEVIPVFPASYIQSLPGKSLQQIGFDVAHAFLRDDLADDVLKKMIDEALSFDAPVVEVEPGIFSLELFHGPTLAFKDFGARFMSQVLGYFAQQQQRQVIILAATSGDTGSAVANGFLGVPGTHVVVLYPSGKVSSLQEKQFTTLGRNITALEVAGTFDDCQGMVKQAFLDPELNKKLFLTSANSINIARLLPQTFYYFYAWSKLANRGPLAFAVPSGNYGNLTAGVLAQRIGLPIQHFIAATNANDIVPRYLHEGTFTPRPSVATISNAMDVGNPSNFVRLLELFQQDHQAMQRAISGYAFTDAETREAMRTVFAQRQYTLDPHGAVGYLGIKKYRAEHPGTTGVFLETAHPAKFKEVVEESIDSTVEIPDRLAAFLGREKKSIPCAAEFENLSHELLKRFA